MRTTSEQDDIDIDAEVEALAYRIVARMAERRRRLAARPPQPTGEASPLDSFLMERCYSVTGAVMRFKDFYEEFVEWLYRRGHSLTGWDKTTVSRRLPAHFPHGARKGNQRWIGNIAFGPGPIVGPTWVAAGGKLRQWAGSDVTAE